MKSNGETVIDVLISWVLPILGGGITVFLLLHFGCRSVWLICLPLPGALVFQWTFLVALMGVARLFRRKQGGGTRQ